ILIAQSVLQANLPQVAVGQDDITYNIIAAVAAALDAGYTELAQTAAQMNIATATGAFLDDLCNEVGVTRIPAAKASGSVVFTLTPGPSTPQTVPVGTVLSTTGTPAQYFLTTQAATIPAGGSSSSSGATLIQANVGAAAGNVNASQIQIVNYQFPPGVLTVTNAAATTGGADAETDTALRARGIAATQVKYGAASLAKAVQNVAGVYDVWINDPSAPPNTDANPSGSSSATGGYNVYWGDIDGNTPGAGSPNTGTALAVLNAVESVQPPGVIPTLAGFTIVNLTAISVGYRIPSSVSPSTFVPALQTAVAAYVQQLLHNAVPDAFTMGQYVQGQVGGALELFTLISTTPTIGSAAHATLYRCTGVPSTVVTCTQI
ncbi:MAG: baseplate J/gp47 family protein, partial [Patescibacteria group bacterium]|nr:baseplate J/gp47 family protein [Patescibacteria group bacterium]